LIGIVGWCFVVEPPCILAVHLCLWDSAGNHWITCESFVSVSQPLFWPLLLMKNKKQVKDLISKK
jgi:hypothetical protein